MIWTVRMCVSVCMCMPFIYPKLPTQGSMFIYMLSLPWHVTLELPVHTIITFIVMMTQLYIHIYLVYFCLCFTHCEWVGKVGRVGNKNIDWCFRDWISYCLIHSHLYSCIYNNMCLVCNITKIYYKTSFVKLFLQLTPTVVTDLHSIRLCTLQSCLRKVPVWIRQWDFFYQIEVQNILGIQKTRLNPFSHVFS